MKDEKGNIRQVFLIPNSESPKTVPPVFSFPCPGLLSGCRGFTLLELLVVCAILATLSIVAVAGYSNVLDESNDRLVRTEMQEIAKAIRQFKADTGYYPKTGPFALAIDNGSVTNGGMPGYIVSTSAALTDDEKRRWFYSPANLYQLTTSTSPLSGITPAHQLAEWDPETGRGWRGPYLKGFKDLYVDIGDDINGTSYTASPTYASGIPDHDPLAGNDIPDVMGVADSFEHSPEDSGGSEVDETMLDWSMHRRRLSSESENPSNPTYYPGRENGLRSKWGRPYLVFGLDQTTLSIGSDKIPGPVIISMGPNGYYDEGVYDPDNKKDDIVLTVN